MPLWPRFLLTSEHIFRAKCADIGIDPISSELDLIALMRVMTANGRVQHPHLIWPDPWPTVVKPKVYINCGRWMISCATLGCGDCPIVHPGWRAAVCFECGAVYTTLDIPANADVIEAILVARPQAVNRNWVPSETVADLIRENREHGLENAWLG